MADTYCDIVAGNDSTGDGSIGNPYKNLKKGITESGVDDTVILAPSSASDYLWETDVPPAGLTIKCLTTPNLLTGVQARITGSAGTAYYLLAGDFTAENVNFYNISTTQANPCIRTLSSGVGSTQQYTNCVFQDLTTSNGTATRGGVLGGDSNATSNVINLDNCLIYNIKAKATTTNFVYVGGSAAWDVNFTGCTFYNDSAGIALTGYCGLYATSSYDFAYVNCAFLNDHTTNPAFTANYTSPGSGAATVDYCVYENMNTGATTITNSTNSDPLFVDKGNTDFRLTPSSPCIDAGVLV